MFYVTFIFCNFLSFVAVYHAGQIGKWW